MAAFLAKLCAYKCTVNVILTKKTPHPSIVNVESKLHPLDAFLCDWKPGNCFSTNST